MKSIRKPITEANVFRKLEKDPVKMKMLSIAMRHDNTLPISEIGKLGPKPTPEQMAQTWSDLLDDALANNPTMNISREGKFDDWLTKLYIDQDFDWEDLTGQAVDALTTWKMLSNRNILDQEDKDFNKFRNLKKLQAVVRKPKYADEIKRAKDAAQIAKMKEEREEIPLIDSDRFFVSMPFNFGACYYLGHVGGGIIPTWCTGSSNGAQWAKRYINDGIMLTVLDKQNMDEINGKWQIHADSNQIKNGNQSENSDKLFSELFPGLMKKIISAIKQKSGLIEQMSEKELGKKYDVNKEIEALKTKFPLSWASVPPESEEEADVDDTEAQEKEPETAEIPASRGGRPQDIPQAREPEAPAAEPAAQAANVDPDGDGEGTYRLTYNGRSVTREFTSRDDARQQMLARNPNLDVDQVEIVKVG